MNDFKRFLILSETDTREPLYILLRLLCNPSENELLCFADTIVVLVENGYLDCYCRSENDYRYEITKENLSERLHSHIKTQLCSGMLWQPEEKPVFEFIQTEKGCEWLNERHKTVERKALGMIENIMRFRRENGEYPKHLSVLCPKYTDVIEEPYEIYGSWWYSVDKEKDVFLFGYFSFFGLLKVLDIKTQEWTEYNS